MTVEQKIAKLLPKLLLPNEAETKKKYGYLYRQGVRSFGEWNAALFHGWYAFHEARSSRSFSRKGIMERLREVRDYFPSQLAHESNIAEVAPEVYTFCLVRFGGLKDALSHLEKSEEEQKESEREFESHVLALLNRRYQEGKWISPSEVKHADSDLYTKAAVGLGYTKNWNHLYYNLGIDHIDAIPRNHKEIGDQFDGLCKLLFQIIKPEWGAEHLSFIESKGKKPDTYNPQDGTWIDFKANGAGSKTVEAIEGYSQITDRIAIVSLVHPVALKNRFPNCEFLSIYDFEDQIRAHGVDFVLECFQKLQVCMEHWNEAVPVQYLSEVRKKLRTTLIEKKVVCASKLATSNSRF